MFKKIEGSLLLKPLFIPGSPLSQEGLEQVSYRVWAGDEVTIRVFAYAVPSTIPLTILASG